MSYMADTITVRLPEGLRARLDEVCADRQVTPTVAVKLALAAWIAGNHEVTDASPALTVQLMPATSPGSDAPISHAATLPAIRHPRPARPTVQVHEQRVRVRGYSATTGEALLEAPIVDVRARNKPKRGS